MRVLVVWIAGLDCLFLLALFIYTQISMRWIIRRWEAAPDLCTHPLFPTGNALTISRVLTYTTRLGWLQFLADSRLEHRVRAGRLPSGTSRKQIYQHFSADEIRKAEHITLALVVGFGLIFAAYPVLLLLQP